MHPLCRDCGALETTPPRRERCAACGCRGWLWGVGRAMQRRLAGDGITLIRQLAEIRNRELALRYGRLRAPLAHLAPGADHRARLAHFQRTPFRPRPPSRRARATPMVSPAPRC